MNRENFNDALNYLDVELVDEFITEKEKIDKNKTKRKVIATFVPLAACFVILLGIGATMLGYYLGFTHNKNGYSAEAEQMRVYFEKEGIFVFEYGGKTHQALVMPMSSGNAFEMAEGEAVSIKDVGSLITKVNVTDKNGNVAIMEIYTTKSNTSAESGDILLKLDSGYFLASGINKNIN